MQRPNFELLRDAFAIIDGIPDSSLNLATWRQKGRKHECGTLACAAGWLAMHPDMNELGLSTGIPYDGMPLFEASSGFSALREFFGLDFHSQNIFEGAGYGYKDGELGDLRKDMTDKQLWKRRVLRLFQEYNEPFDPMVGEGLHLDARRQ
ncbi:hypothetical protein WK03_35245 [Burkholderia cepacia]|uniref:hypothetical protein n=1 Tax=Burkholderia cepacia TaxID=292 RepID=UPI000757AB18|nr:hypothetical protein [Burkholderia cepacia]KVQ35726.1 hypothetical protein WK03_35245 [Burkholderia cepacia]